MRIVLIARSCDVLMLKDNFEDDPFIFIKKHQYNNTSISLSI